MRTHSFRRRSASTMAGPSFTRARARTRRRRAVLAVLVCAIPLGIGLPATGDGTDEVRAAAVGNASTVPALGKRWFALGANVPWLDHGCDFGCGLNRGIRGRNDDVDSMFRGMSRRGVRVARWYLFPGDAWQLTRRPDGSAQSVRPAALRDLDVAVRLAAKHDVYLVPVVLPEPQQVPSSWFTDGGHRAALARALRPMFARYRHNQHVLAWEVTTGAERLVAEGVANRAQVRAQVLATGRALRGAAPRRMLAIGTGDVTGIDTWTGLGADIYLPQDLASSGPACASCRSAASVRASEGADAPIVIGGFTSADGDPARSRLERYRRLGYAGALAWSWRGRPHPAGDGRIAPMPDAATWRFHYARLASGPRSRALNPCYGPAKRLFRCPNLMMSTPSSVTLGRRGSRSILYSTNSLDSRGAGPASLRGTRDGRFTMAASQVLHRVDGRRTIVRTGGKLLFKAIPGQYRYWKWNGAARMELWRLDAGGTPVTRAKVGPKTVYCLRDLQRRFGFLPRSPGGRVYPGCSQSLSRQSVTLGTSVGWSDVYPASYHENWIDVTGLRGCFAYVHVADPTNVIYESDEDDNTSHVVVKLPWTGSNAGCPGARPIPSTGANGTY